MKAGNKPLRRDAQENRRKIIDGAERAFAQLGIDASFEAIAKESAVAVGTVHRHFPQKELLVEAIFDARISEAEAAALEASQNPDPFAGLIETIEFIVRLQQANLGFKQLAAYGANGSERVGRAFLRLEPIFSSICIRLHESGQVANDFDATDISIIISMLGSTLSGTTHIEGEPWRRQLHYLLYGVQSTNSPPVQAIAAADIPTVLHKGAQN